MPRIRYSCSCPDFVKKQSFLINSNYDSQLVTKDWSNSNAGIDEGKYCKHIFAVRILRGELPKSEIPTDIPIPKTDKYNEGDNMAQRYQDGYNGHDFSGNWGVTTPRRYKGG